MAQSFTAEIDAWIKESKERVHAVIQKSAERIVEEIQLSDDKGGLMPIDTGFLRASMRAQLGSPVTVSVKRPPRPKGTTGQIYDWNNSDLTFAIANMEIGDVFYATYTANYAPYVEYGANGRPGRAFVRTAAARWQETVNEVVSELKVRSAR